MFTLESVKIMFEPYRYMHCPEVPRSMMVASHVSVGMMRPQCYSCKGRVLTPSTCCSRTANCRGDKPSTYSAVPDQLIWYYYSYICIQPNIFTYDFMTDRWAISCSCFLFYYDLLVTRTDVLKHRAVRSWRSTASLRAPSVSTMEFGGSA